MSLIFYIRNSLTIMKVTLLPYLVWFLLFPAFLSGQDIYEPNNESTNPTQITCGNTYEAFIQTIGDVDWFEIQTNNAGVLSVELTSVPFRLDLNLEIYQFSGNQLKRIADDDSDNANGGQDLTATSFVEAGNYLILVNDENNNSLDDLDSYELRVRCIQDQLEVNQTIQLAKRIPQDTCFEGSIWGENECFFNSNEGDDDQEWFEVIVTETGTLNATLTSVPTLLDLNLEIYILENGLPKRIADDDDSNANGGQNLTTTAFVAPDTYYIHIEDELFNVTIEETYLFCLNFTPNPLEVNQTIDLATTIPQDTCFEDNIWGENECFFNSNEGDDDQEWYRVEINESGILQATLTSVPTPLDLNLEIYIIENNLPKKIADDDDGNANGGQDLIAEAFISPGTYYIHIEDELFSVTIEETYLFCLNFTPNPLEVNQTIDLATTIPQDTCFAANIWGENECFFTTNEGDNDQEWFVINIASAGTLNTSVTSVPSNLDLNLELYIKENTFPTLIANDGNGNADGGEDLTLVTFIEQGTYYIHIEDENNNFTIGEEFLFCVNFSPLTCRESDSLTLVQFYNSTNGTSWDSFTWDLTQPMDNWDGVGLDNTTGCVIELIIGSNNLNGTIPPEIGNLSELKNLFILSNPNLIGSIPKEIGNLTNLENLTFFSCGLTGNIPDEIGELINLKELSFANNNLSGPVPPSIGNLIELENLYLDNNDLEGEILSYLVNLTKLEELFLSTNKLTGQIPLGISNLISLKKFIIPQNNFEGSIPPQIGQLTEVQEVLLNENNFTGQIPPEISNLNNLKLILLQENQLSGCFDEGLRSICDALSFTTSFVGEGYNFTNNPMLPWEGDFERFCNNEPQFGASCNDNNPNTVNDQIQPDCTCAGNLINPCRVNDSLELVRLFTTTNGTNWKTNTNWLRPNQPIDTWYGITLTAEGCVKTIILSNNELSGTFPNLTFANLDTLDLQVNDLSGQIQVQNLPSLTYLDCGLNQLTGNIPSFENAPNFRFLDCDFNRLEGSIPNFNLANLQVVDCNVNNLSGEIPNFENAPTLRFLDCSNNNIEGNIPEFNFSPRLLKFYCHKNLIEGEIPDLSHLAELTEIFADSNKLSGCLPVNLFFCDLDSFKFNNNPMLPWEGDLSNLCPPLNLNPINAPCDDLNSSTDNDTILPDCTCKGCEDAVEEIEIGQFCEGSSFDWRGNTYTIPGNYFDTLLSISQTCDSIYFKLELEETDVLQATLNSELCEGDTILWNNQIITASGEFEFLTQNIDGCDSIIKNIVTLGSAPTLPTLIDVFCEGDVYTWNNESFTNPGTFTRTITADIGCDTVATLDLTMLSQSEVLLEDDFYTLSTSNPSLTLLLFENDFTPSDRQFSILSSPALGALTIIQDGEVQYAVFDNASAGSDSFSYEVCHDFCDQICDTANAFITIEDDCLTAAKEQIINAFSPNNDGKNDLFDPIGQYVELGCQTSAEDAELTILNRWGDRIFVADPYQPWQGKTSNGNTFPEATYYFILKIDGSESPIKGPINLIEIRN